MSVAEQACTYAALILADEGMEITAENVSAILDSADVEVEAIFPKLFAKAFEGKDLSSYFLQIGGGSAGGVAAAAPGAGAAAEQAKGDDKKADKKQEKEEEPEGDDDMGFGLFD